MVALVSFVTAGSCHIEAVGVVHHSRTRGAHSCIPVSECRSVPSVHLRCLTLERLSGLTPGLRQHCGRCPASMAWSSRSAWLRGFGEFVIGRQRPNHGCALSFSAARPWRLECFWLKLPQNRWSHYAIELLQLRRTGLPSLESVHFSPHRSLKCPCLPQMIQPS